MKLGKEMEALYVLGVVEKTRVTDRVGNPEDCGATREWINDAPKIVRSSAEARKQFAGDIVATGFALWGITQWIARQETLECFREAE